MCLCPHCKFEEVLVPRCEPLGLRLLCLFMLYIGSMTWVSAGKHQQIWVEMMTAAHQSHSDTSWASQRQAQARGCAWGWQLRGAIPGGAEPQWMGSPGQLWAGGCSGQKASLDSRLTLSWKDLVYWAVLWNLGRKTNHPVKQSKRRRLHKYGLEPSEKKCFLHELGFDMLSWALLHQCVRT